MKKIVIIGPFPPPVYGMSKNLQIVADTLDKNATVTRIGVSPGSIIRGKRYYLEKIVKGLIGAGRLLFIGLASRNISLYMPPDAGFGMYYSFLFISMARLFRMRIFLHHRSFAYINKYNLTMSNIVKIAGKNALHIFLCKNMKTRFQLNYGDDFNSLIVSNAQHVDAIEYENIKSVNSTFIIGHLSNLGFDKGLKDVFELFEHLIKEKHKVKLVIAGPSENQEVESFLRTKLDQLGEFVEYRGFVDKTQKFHFFNDIDLFLFPSRYKNEAQPNVIFEANAHGVPVITLQRGCIDSDVNQENGAVLDPQDNFTTQAYPILKAWLSSSESYMQLKQSTYIKTRKAIENAQQDFDLMISEIKK